MSTQQILDRLVEEFDRWECKNHRLEQRATALDRRREFLSQYPFKTKPHLIKPSIQTRDDLYEFLVWLVFRLRPLGGIAAIIPGQAADAAAGKLLRLHELVRVAMNGHGVAAKVDPWDIPYFRPGGLIVRKIVATYFPNETMPIFNQAHVERFVEYLELDKDNLARTRYKKNYESLLSGQKWELLTDALLDCKKLNARLAREDNVYFMYVLYARSARPDGMGEWKCNGNGTKSNMHVTVNSSNGNVPRVGDVETDPDPVSAIITLHSGIGRGQAFHNSPKARRAIELHAVEYATRHYSSRGWDVKDRSSDCLGYDLLCAKGRHELKVEVKGTTGDGTTVLLTRNEAEKAREAHPDAVLFIVSEIRLDKLPGERPQASGGKDTVFERWTVDDGTLTVVAYKYEPPKKGNRA